MRVALVVLIAGLVSAFSTPATAQPGFDFGSLRILGFSDMKFEAVDEADTGVGATSGFRIGQLILHFMRPLSNRWSFFAETATTAKSDGTFSVSFERVIARYRYSEYLKLSMGRFHTPVNWWNESFHHGQWLQTTADRPEMTKFGGRFVPVHFVGIMEEGSANTGPVTTSWKLGIGNGRQSNIAQAGEGGDVDTHRALLAGIDFRPDAFYRLQIGGSVYADAVPLHLHGDVDELLIAGHLIWYGETPEFIAEYANVHHDAIAGSEDGDSAAWYAQVGYRLSGGQERFKPYVRYEQIDIDEKDPIYGTEGFSKHTVLSTVLDDMEIVTAGLRMDVAALVALKLELQARKVDDNDWYRTYVAQLALSF